MSTSIFESLVPEMFTWLASKHIQLWQYRSDLTESIGIQTLLMIYMTLNACQWPWLTYYDLGWPTVTLADLQWPSPRTKRVNLSLSFSLGFYLAGTTHSLIQWHDSMLHRAPPCCLLTECSTHKHSVCLHDLHWPWLSSIMTLNLNYRPSPHILAG